MLFFSPKKHENTGDDSEKEEQMLPKVLPWHLWHSAQVLLEAGKSVDALDYLVSWSKISEIVLQGESPW